MNSNTETKHRSSLHFQAPSRSRSPEGRTRTVVSWASARRLHLSATSEELPRARPGRGLTARTREHRRDPDQYLRFTMVGFLSGVTAPRPRLGRAAVVDASGGADTGSRSRTCACRVMIPMPWPLGYPSMSRRIGWTTPGSNRAPSLCESNALPNELEVLSPVLVRPSRNRTRVSVESKRRSTIELRVWIFGDRPSWIRTSIARSSDECSHR